MKEAVYRRYKRLIDENTTLPQLVIIDGGKGQLSAALESIEQLGLLGKLTLVGIAKNQEELFFANDSESLQLPWDSDSLKLIRRIRDEVHRFGITHHRNRRSKSALDNELIHISGIGKSTAEMLLQHFRTIKNIKAATEKEIANVVGLKRAKILTDYFKL
jgi:excinuclease ABC subunit C